MKALITIIVVAVLAWALWAFVIDNDPDIEVENTPAAVNAALNGDDDSVDAGADIDLSEFEDKG